MNVIYNMTMNTQSERVGVKFKDYINLREGKENFEQPHTIAAEPPMKLPMGIERIGEAFKKSKEVPIGKEVDTKAGGEKDITLKSKKVYVVGDAVLDYMLGHTPSKYELCTDAHPDEVERILTHARPAINIIRKDKKGGIVKVSVDGEQYDIETMRKPGVDDQGGITYTTNQAEDSERRKFTVNSLYYDIAGKKIMDFTGGIRHIQDGTVKFVGRPEDRLSQDGMSKYHYARMLNKVPNSKADKDTKNAIAKMDSGEDLSPEQIRNEFWQGMEDLHTNAEKYLKTYHELGLLQTVFPKLTLSMDFPNCRTCKSRPIILASLLKNNKPQKLVEKLKELKYTDREIKDAVFLINLLVFSPEYIYDYKKELLNTSLTKRQIMDWVKVNNLDSDLIEKLLNHDLATSSSDVMDKEGISGDHLKERVRRLEAQSFMKSMRD